MSSIVRVLAVVSCAVVVSQCGPVMTVETEVPLPSHSEPDGSGGLAYEGRLERQGPCIWLDPGLNLLWPPGYRWRPSEGTVVTSQGETVARIGDDIVIDGSAIRDAIAPLGCSNRRGAAVARIVEVDGVRVVPTEVRPHSRIARRSGDRASAPSNMGVVRREVLPMIQGVSIRNWGRVEHHSIADGEIGGRSSTAAPLWYLGALDSADLVSRL